MIFLLLWVQLISCIQLWETQWIASHDSAHVHPHKWIPQIFNGYPQGIYAQLNGGIRGLEFDLARAVGDSYSVENLPVLDPVSNCGTLRDCMKQVIDWTQFHPDHFPIFIHLDPEIDRSFSTISNMSDWNKLINHIKELFKDKPSRLFTPSDFEKSYPNLDRIGKMEIDNLKGKIIILIDTFENDINKWLKREIISYLQMPFWPYCSRSEVMYAWCQFITTWNYIPPKKESFGLVSEGYILRIIVDYRLIQIPGHNITKDTVSYYTKKGVKVTQSLEEWYATTLYILLDSSQDGYVNFLDKIVITFLETLKENRWYITLILQIGLPSPWLIWAVIKYHPRLLTELYFSSNIMEAFERQTNAFKQCGNILTTDFPSSLFGNFPYSVPIPINGEYYISTCSSSYKYYYIKVETNPQNFQNSWLLGSAYDEYGTPQEIAPRGITYILCCIYGLFWLIIIIYFFKYILKMIKYVVTWIIRYWKKNLFKHRFKILILLSINFLVINFWMYYLIIHSKLDIDTRSL